MDIKKLQNYSDIRGIVVTNERNEEINFTKEIAAKLADAFTSWCGGKNKTISKIAIGMDSRLLGEELKKSTIECLLNKGIDVIDCGLTITPALYYAIDTKIADAGIMITASHLPYNRNGMKFITREGSINYNGLNEIIEIANNPGIITGLQRGTFEIKEINTPYSEKIKNFIINQVSPENNSHKPLEKLKIIIDAGNGASGFVSDKIFSSLGADTSGSINLNPDGNFPDHEPNTESEAALESLQKQVLEKKADIGILFDSDADRCAFVSNNGKKLLHNNLIALISIIVLEENPKATIVTDSITSDELSSFIYKELGGRHHKFRRGYKRVINEAIRLNNEGIDCPLAIETSGHAAFKENNFIDDGVFLAAKVVSYLMKLKIKSNGAYENLYNRFNYSKESIQFRLKIKSENIETESNRIIQTFKKFSENVPGWKIVINNFDGVRITADKCFGDGWLILRLSIHEPVVVLHIESGSKKGISILLTRVDKLLSKISSVDISSIKKYIAQN
ncbi:MAG: phosphomannomutase/phosphoglucomutase [Bacteroidales bacterium]|nr:phosphomannomutase/phosphoglucomutase [Bacteroidales bacterium]